MVRHCLLRPFVLDCLRPLVLVCGVAFELAVAPMLVSAETRPSRVIVDLGDPQAFKLYPSQCQTIIVRNEAVGRDQAGPGEGGSLLQITTDAQASWPGVNIVPREGKWDLSDFDRVEMGIRNPQDVPVRVLLCINNPGADGLKHCNVDSATVPPGGHVTLVVPFGTYHDDPDRPIDLHNVVSVKVQLDQPGRGHRFLVGNIRAVPFDRSAMQQVFSDPFFQQLWAPFGRGINMGNMLEAASKGSRGLKLKPEYFEIIKRAGFGSVRIPVGWPVHAQESAPYQIDAAFFSRVDEVVREALAQQLQVVLDLHYYDELLQQPKAHRERFLAIWRQIAEHYRDYPPDIAFELLNEPMGKITAEIWNGLVADALAVVRRSNPTRQVVIGPVGWNPIEELETMDLPESDRHLVVTIHYYEPSRFTHQGANWIGSKSFDWLGTKWLGTADEKRAIERDFNRAITWAVRHRRPLYLGEFGAYHRADIESRARWTRFIAQQAIERKIGFGYWEFCAGFGIYDPLRQKWIEPLKDALLSAGEP